MTRAGRAISWFREISVLAEDEQRRSGHPEIEVEHLLLALLGAGGTVTRRLSRAGVTLDRARAAFEEVHRRRLARLGIADSPGDAGSRTIPPGNARGAFRYRAGVRRMLEEAARRPHPDIALFTTLTREPSGHVREALRELGVIPDEIEFLDAESDATPPDDRPRPRSAGECRRFVPAPPHAVWTLVSSPERWREWNPVAVSGHRSDLALGEPAPKVVALHAPEWVHWELPAVVREPDARLLGIRLEPDEAGTTVVLSLPAVASSGGSRGVRAWMQRRWLRGIADGISRALRS